jgi:hypothetical protein
VINQCVKAKLHGFKGQRKSAHYPAHVIVVGIRGRHIKLLIQVVVLKESKENKTKNKNNVQAK